MAKNTQPVLKRCRTLGVSPAAMGYSKQSNRNPGGKINILVTFHVPHRGVFGFIGIEVTHDADTARRRL